MLSSMPDAPALLKTQLTGAKIFYDQNGEASEVLISYDLFRHLLEWLEQGPTDASQAYFWSTEWQARIREGEADLQAGKTFQATADTLEDALTWLDE